VGETADDLFRQAYAKFETALNAKPDTRVLLNWGIVLMEQAKQKTDKAADDFFRQAYEKFAEALKIEPGMHVALYTWGLALASQAKQKTTAEAKALFDMARTKYEQANSIVPGSAAYDLACLSALLEETGQCRKYLEESRDRGLLPPAAYVESDSDLVSVRQSEWFVRFISDLRLKPAT
jgi:tetratricopeptide (TPR) repeat protein